MRKATKKASASKKATSRTTTAKKTLAKKTTAKRGHAMTAKKAPVAKKVVAAKAITKVPGKLSKSQLTGLIAESTGLGKREVVNVFDAQEQVITASIKKGGPGTFVLPGLLKITTIRKPATKARKGTNPFTGEETMFKAKPARTVVKVRPLKKLKDMV